MEKNNEKIENLKIPKVETLTVNSTAKSEMSDYLKSRIESLRKIIAKYKKERGNQARIPINVIKEALDIHYTYSLSMSKLANGIGVADVTVGYWKRKHGSQQTGVIYGTTTRNDIRTKCIAVKEYVELNVSKEHLAERYHVGKSTISSWINRYKDEYEKWIDAPDGITVVAKEDRLIYGDRNIKEVREFMMLQNDELRDMVQNMQKYGIMANAILQAKKRCVENQEDIDALNKAEDILKKTKKGKQDGNK